MSVWRHYQQMCDPLVDQYFAEPVEFYPWTTDATSSPSDSGQLDSTREVGKYHGIKVCAGASIVGEAGSARAFGGNVRLLGQDVWISITDDQFDWLQWKADDRVFLPERNEWYAIVYTGPSQTGRPDVHLLRLQDSAL